MNIPSFAKINLGLHVLEKRIDGYHNIETIFYRIRWKDTLRFMSSDKIEMVCYEKDMPTDERNLCMKAALKLASYAPNKGVLMYLEKEIPHGAGLGGGSGNAATVLKTLNQLWEIGLSEAELLAIGATLGADVPFFLKESPQFATQKGDILTDFNYHFPYYLVVMKPKCSVPTADAYQHIKPNTVNRPNLQSLVATNDLDLWKSDLVNDFEESVFQKYPEIAIYKQEFYNCGAAYSAMSGSGSAVFGVFTDKEAAQQSHYLHAIRGFSVWSNVVKVRE